MTSPTSFRSGNFRHSEPEISARRFGQVPAAILRLGPTHPTVLVCWRRTGGITDRLRQVAVRDKVTAGRRLPAGSYGRSPSLLRTGPRCGLWSSAGRWAEPRHHGRTPGSAGRAGSGGSQHGIALGGGWQTDRGWGSPFLTLEVLPGHWTICSRAAPSAVASAGRLCRIAKRGAHPALTGTDGACDTLAADNLDTGLARVQVIDMTLAVTFRAGLLDTRPRQARLLQRSHHRRCRAR